MRRFLLPLPNPRRVGAVLLLTASLVASPPVADRSVRAAELPAGQTTLRATAWSASAFGNRAGGTLCWLLGPDRSLRLEVRQAAAADRAAGSAPVDLAPLFTRTGEGWTLILGTDLTGTLNAWQREWQEVPLGLARVVRLVTAAVDGYPAARPRLEFATAAGAGADRHRIARPRFLAGAGAPEDEAPTWRFQLPPLRQEARRSLPPADFRRRLVARGRGTGGEGEILVLAWQPTDGGGDPGLRVTSTRRPGTLVLAPPAAHRVPVPEPEVFLPLWPLDQFFDIP